MNTIESFFGGRGGPGRVENKNLYLLRTPPSKDAFKHSGGDNLLCTSATVTLYFDVELRSDRRPGTEQKTSVGAAESRRPSLPAF